ncbi:hypothetical protein [Winogradskyella sp.]|uniref:hypothetical protein n=1 Tax=Winogradskyella sp. TaxID=1883156 RepID=UPI001B1745DB|nr:hypothetical protein [Winogradskyella sp.]MBO6881447.1 hypothetical protein [Winogradskyella sp.]
MRYNMGASREIYYGNIIKNYDPDVLIYDDDIVIEELSVCSTDIQTIKLSAFKDSLERFSVQNGVSIDVVLNSLINEEFKYTRTDNVKISIPNIQNNDILLSAWQGSFLDKINNQIVHHLSKRPYIDIVDFNYQNFNDFFELDTTSLKYINTYKTRLLYDRGLSKNTVLFFIDHTNNLDIIDYWNLRALGWKIVPIPISKMNSASYRELIIYILKEREQNDRGFKLKIADVLIAGGNKRTPVRKYIDTLIKKEKIGITVPEQNWFPRLWHDDYETLKYDFVYCPQIYIDSVDENLTSEKGDYISFNLPKLPFETKFTNSGLFKTNVSLSYWEDEGKYAEVITGITTRDWHIITKSFGFTDEWKISKNGIFKYVNHQNDRASFYLPESSIFFNKFFANKGISIKQTASGKLGYKVLKNIGGVHGANLFSTTNAIKIIELFENGKIVSHEELTGKINRYKPYPEFKNPRDVIDLFLRKQIIEFGINIQCTVCEQRTFYLPKELNDKLKCSICRSTFSLPRNDPKNTLKFVYRGVGPFSRNNKVDGLLSVFLTIRLFKLDLSDGIERISFIFDFDAKKGDNDFEVDLAVLSKSYKYNNRIESFICECKTFKSINKKDYLRLKFFGEQMVGTTLVVATLKSEFSDEEKVLLKRLVNDFRTSNFDTTNPVLLLTGNELIPNKRGYGLSEYNDIIKNYSHVSYVKYLADLSCEKHLGLTTCAELRDKAWENKMKKSKK